MICAIGGILLTAMIAGVFVWACLQDMDPYYKGEWEEEEEK